MTLRERAEALLTSDTAIAHELLAMAQRNVAPAPAARVGVSTASIKAFVEGQPGWSARARSGAEADGRFHVEAVVLAHGRPSMLVQHNRIQVPESPELRRRIEATRVRYESRLASVGRVELSGHPRLQQAGTAWIVAENLVVTNAHVAAEFVAREQSHLVFRRTFGDAVMSACVDLREEYVDAGTPEEFEIGVDQVLYLADLADVHAPDLALLRLSPGQGVLLPPIPFVDVPLEAGRDIAVVGFPAEDPIGAGSIAIARRLFAGIYGVKRFSPGKVGPTPAGSWAFAHDATTLGGSSGSVVIDLETGGAVGVHFAGALERANYAVRGRYVLDAIAAATPMVTVPELPVDPVVGAEPRPLMPAATGYDMRDGYRADFLGADHPAAPLPEITRADDVLEMSWQGTVHTVVPYRHFSVVMSARRRMCYLSAVNIDGARSVPHLRRRDWRFDPRLPESTQLSGPMYGNPPRFSRGHMTRREDPAWGETRAEADEGNTDTMHLANAVPQMQPFNAGIWLGLEDYALQNAREDDQKISVMTGPVLRDDDPMFEGVAVPLEFWKAIVFVHDETGRLSVSGYVLSQRGFLPHREAVFGAYETYQVPLTAIERRAGLRFGALVALDVFATTPEGAARPLLSPDEIRWR